MAHSEGPEGARVVVALVADLIFAARIRGAADRAGVTVFTANNASKLADLVEEHRPGLILVDLDARVGDAPSLIAELKGPDRTGSGRAGPGQVIAFGSHLEREVLLAAREAGADRVLARSAFVRDLPSILQGMDIAGPDDG